MLGMLWLCVYLSHVRLRLHKDLREGLARGDASTRVGHSGLSPSDPILNLSISNPGSWVGMGGE